MAITLYGISNCDTVRKARKFLEGAGVDYRFHDVRKDGLDAATVSAWLEQVPVETLINKRGTSWRALPESERNDLTATRAQSLAVANPTLVKRPVVDWGDQFTVGFDPADWAARLS